MGVQLADLRISIDTFAHSVRGPLATLPFEGRQGLVRTVIERVMVEEGQVDIHFAIPVLDAPKEGPPGRHAGVSTNFRLRSNDND